MKLSKRTNTIILWVISIGLLVSMVIAFTPTLGGLFGGGANSAAGINGNGNSPALLVNGKAITELEVARALQNRGNTAFEGEVGEDLDLLTLDGLIQNEVLEQAASNIRVSDGDVRNAVNEWRQQQNVAGRGNDQRYLSLIGQAGFDDQSFRAAFRTQLRLDKYREQITKDITVSDEEVQAFYELNPNRYESEERIKARQIVVEDEALATELSERIAEGEDFAALAEEFSLERSDRAGALGAPEGSKDPQAVGRAALPTQVAASAFALQGSGVTDVISFNGKYYLISIEEYIASGTRPFDEVEESARADALEAKQNGVLEETFTRLRETAQVSAPEDSLYSFNDEVVAKVGDESIMRSELARVVYSDPQVSQALRPDTASIITGLFKPSYLERLIDSELAFQGASELDASFIGSKGQIAQNALEFVSKDANASEEDYQTYYADNIARFTIPASATASRVNFTSEAEALAFREAMLAGGELADSAEAHGGSVIDLGIVRAGSLAPELDRVLFETESFEALEDGNDISDVIVITETVEQPAEEIIAAEANEDSSAEETSSETSETEPSEDTSDSATSEQSATETSSETPEEASNGSEEDSQSAETTDAETTDAELTTTEIIDTYVVLIAERTPETIRPFEEVSGQVETAVLQSKRSELQTTWLDGLRETITIENLLADAAEQSQPEVSFETTPLEDGATPDETTSEEATPNESTSEEAAQESESTSESNTETTPEEDSENEEGTTDEDTSD